MALPIIFIHRGNSPYLPFTLGQAKLRNPASPVILLGDHTNYVLPFVRHVNMAGYSRRATEFAKIYRHLCTNGVAYELFCFQRWLILNEFVESTGIDRFIHVDSDVLLYVDVSREAEHWAEFDLTFVRKLCPGNMFVRRREAIAELADIVWNMYADPAILAQLEREFAERQSRREPGGICDMWAHNHYCRVHPYTAGEMTGVQPDGSFWDANIHESEGFEMREEGIKLVRYVDGVPYCRLVPTGRNIRMNALHFQGAAKKYVEWHFRAGIESARKAHAA